MSRLTKKDITNIIDNKTTFLLSRVTGKKLTAQILKEMLAYKDLEEKFNANLITVFKALTDGIYVNDGTSIIFYPARELRVGYDTHYGKGELCILKDCGYAGNIKLVSLTNEGKSWALTKEELL